MGHKWVPSEWKIPCSVLTNKKQLKASPHFEHLVVSVGRLTLMTLSICLLFTVAI